MPRSLGPCLPPSLYALLDGERLHEKVGVTIQCGTVDENGRVHLAMISVGELVAMTANELRLAIWQSASTAQRMLTHPRCTLVLVWEGAVYVIHCRVRWLADLDGPPGPPLKVFVLTLEEVQADFSSYARVTSGITFELHDSEPVLARWRATVDRLRALPAS